MKHLKEILTESILTGDHAIHEILLYMDNDPKMEKIIQPIVKEIVGYLKNHNSTFDELVSDFKYEMVDIIRAVPFITSFNNTTIKKAECFVLQSILYRIDDEYGLKPKNWDSKAYDINDLKW